MMFLWIVWGSFGQSKKTSDSVREQCVHALKVVLMALSDPADSNPVFLQTVREDVDKTYVGCLFSRFGLRFVSDVS